MKENKTKYLRGPSVFEFIVNNLGPFEKPFHKLGLRVSTDFQTLETIRALDLRPLAFISFLVFGNPDETLAHVHDILLHICCFSRSLDYVVCKEKNVICGIIYRQHDSPESLQSYLDEVLERISSNDKTVHIMGHLIQPKPLQR